MKELRSPRRLFRIWHRREKAIIDHLVHSIGDAETSGASTHSPFTASGQAIEDQVRKAWCPAGGLAVF